MRTGDPTDGCAIFWRASRFKLLLEESIQFNKLGLRDNVAQICVFESVNGQNYNNRASTVSTTTSLARSNRVVVCNIHVLFNPKRGDIKLGQIRTLLNRAQAVSKLWDDAPIVICGDFNCTPKSPMYNFIAEQKLDLSDLARDQVSGQAASEIRQQRRPAYPGFSTQAADKFPPVSAVDCENVEDLSSDGQNLANLHVSTRSPPAGSYAKPGSPVLEATSCITEEHRTGTVNDFPSNDEANIINCSVSNAQDASTIFPNRTTNKNSVLGSSSEEITSETEGRENVESYAQSLPKTPDTQSKDMCLPENHSDDLSQTSEPMVFNNSDKSQLERPSGNLSPSYPEAASSKPEGVVSSAHGNKSEWSDASASCVGGRVDITLDENFEALSLEEVDNGVTEELTEDRDSFFSELLYTGQNPFPTDTDSSSSNEQLHLHKNEILNPNLKHENINNVGNFPYNASAWTPTEIQTATGSADCKVMAHPLKLMSAYTEVESSSGLRDLSGEPFVTSYHRRFLGTVDYIWHTEGLETVKVLAPIPKDVMQQTRGFPTKKWGSDHIALVSEFAFANEVPSENSNQ